MYFNPRSHERSDYESQVLNQLKRISIHAPTRGATYALYLMRAVFYFNPRSHERSDFIKVWKRRNYKMISIHAPTRGATRDCQLCRKQGLYFNPRSHERSDSNGLMMFDDTLISIHAPTRGATWIDWKSANDKVISIHAPTRGATAILHKKFVYFYTIPTINI